MDEAFVWGHGPVPCPGLILGEAPGENEEKEGVPFVGLSGKLLDEALEAAGITRAEVYVTNAYKLRPENNRTPTEDELIEHEPLLQADIAFVKPKAVLALGNVAMGAMTRQFEGITKVHGTWLLSTYQVIEGERLRVLPAYHPSYVLRQGGRESHAASHFFQDVAAFVKAAFG